MRTRVFDEINGNNRIFQKCKLVDEEMLVEIVVFRRKLFTDILAVHFYVPIVT